MPDVTTSGSNTPHGGSLTQDQVLDRVDLAVIATDADGVVMTWNARAESLYGWTREEALGCHISELTVPADAQKTAEEIMASLQRGESWQGSFRLRRKDGSRFTAFVKDSPILNDEGRLIGIVGVSIEIGDPELAKAVRSLISDSNHNSGRRTRTLSPREREVLGLLARGLTGEQIAERLVLSPETVRTHIRNAREKLGASTRVEAVTMALLAREIQV
ncbi:MAG TPA: LuxR C-terminal-related transcriptional regulator [Thermoleophilaceae bacterium]